MNWSSYALGALSSVFVGIILTAVKSYFDKESRRIQRQIEVAEMVGAIRSEMSNVTRRIDSLTHKLDKHIERCDARWHKLDYEPLDIPPN